MRITQRIRDLIEEKQSAIMAGLDPAPAQLGREQYSLPPSTDTLSFARHYVAAVVPYVVVLKLNVGYFLYPDGIRHIRAIVRHAHVCREH